MKYDELVELFEASFPVVPRLDAIVVGPETFAAYMKFCADREGSEMLTPAERRNRAVQMGYEWIGNDGVPVIVSRYAPEGEWIPLPEGALDLANPKGEDMAKLTGGMKGKVQATASLGPAPDDMVCNRCGEPWGEEPHPDCPKLGYRCAAVTYREWNEKWKALAEGEDG